MKTITTQFSGIPTDVSIIAQRGDMMYGIAMTPHLNIALANFLITDNGMEITVKNTIYFNEIMNESPSFKNNVLVTVGVFLGNAYLRDIPGVMDSVVEKVHALVKAMPKVEVF